MTVFVIGATSQIGHFLIPRLAASLIPVVALSRARRESATPEIRWIQGELPLRVPAPGPVDTIVSFGPLDGLAAWLAHSFPEGLTSVVATSSMSAESKRNCVIDSDREISQRLRDGESQLIEQCERRGIAWTILRPTLIYGGALDASLTPIAKRAARMRIFPMPRASGLRQPVHADDVALAVMRVLQSPPARRRIFSLGGGERLTLSEMFTRVRRSLPVSTLEVPVPGWMLAIAAKIRPELAGPVTRLNEDLIVDNAEIVHALGISPRKFQPTRETWRL